VQAANTGALGAGAVAVVAAAAAAAVVVQPGLVVKGVTARGLPVVRLAAPAGAGPPTRRGTESTFPAKSRRWVGGWMGSAGLVVVVVVVVVVCVCVFVCLCVCVCVSVCSCVPMLMWACVAVSVHMHTRVGVRGCACVCLHPPLLLTHPVDRLVWYRSLSDGCTTTRAVLRALP
jgi:hypothetical protein